MLLEEVLVKLLSTTARLFLFRERNLKTSTVLDCLHGVTKKKDGEFYTIGCKKLWDITLTELSQFRLSHFSPTNRKIGFLETRCMKPREAIREKRHTILPAFTRFLNSGWELSVIKQDINKIEPGQKFNKWCGKRAELDTGFRNRVVIFDMAFVCFLLTF